jgi:hypothetical protein
VAAINNLYTTVATWGDPELLETVWSDYERNLNEAIDLLIAGRLDGRMWIRILVPFVSAMLVRGPDFDLRFERRIRALGIDPRGEHVSEDNVNGARLLELQRLLGPIAVARWAVIHIIANEPLLTNDLAYAPFTNLATGDRGIAIPLSLSHVLTLSPRVKGEILRVVDGSWIPLLDHAQQREGIDGSLNQAISALSQRFLFGPDEPTVTRYLRPRKAQPLPPEPQQLGFITDPLARAHEFTWHRLAAAVERDPDDQDAWCQWQSNRSGRTESRVLQVPESGAAGDPRVFRRVQPCICCPIHRAPGGGALEPQLKMSA